MTVSAAKQEENQVSTANRGTENTSGGNKQTNTYAVTSGEQTAGLHTKSHCVQCRYQTFGRQI